MEQRMGRPPKATTEEKLAIVNQYYITKTDGNASQLRTHGIFRRLSQFAKARNCPLEPHDFSRDEAVRKLIDQLADTSLQEEKYTAIDPVYEPLDITSLMMSGRNNIDKVLKDREEYFLALHLRAAKAIERYALAAQQCAYHQSEAASLKKQNAELQAQIDVLSTELRNALRDVAYLKRVIRKDVEPERAQRFLEGMTSQEAVVDAVESSVAKKINTLVRDDRQLKGEAQAEVDILDLNSLFR